MLAGGQWDWKDKKGKHRGMGVQMGQDEEESWNRKKRRASLLRKCLYYRNWITASPQQQLTSNVNKTQSIIFN
jgi:hypothetical protein